MAVHLFMRSWRRLVPVAALIASAATWTPSTLAQQRARDISGTLPPGTTVTNDPRRLPAPSTPGGPPGTLVLRNGEIFDGVSGSARAATLVISRNRIMKVLPAGSTDWPADARVIDASGKTVMAGLIDLHTHLTSGQPGAALGPTARTVPANNLEDATLRAVEMARYYVESGITSIRDVGSLNEVPFRLKDWINANKLPGPRVFGAGEIIMGTAKGRIGPSGPDEWREAVRDRFAKGADLIKIQVPFTRDEIAAAIQEAHALGVRVTVDAEAYYIQWAVEAGIDCIEHSLVRTDAVVKQMGTSGTYSVPTLAITKYYRDVYDDVYGSQTLRTSLRTQEENLALFRKMRSAGIKMGVGLDLFFGWFKSLPTPYIQELKLFVEAGYTIPEALVAATKTSAEILDMDDRLGTLEPGKLADVLVVNGKPHLNLDDLAKVDIVIRDGHVVVEQGRVVIPRHITEPVPGKRTDTSSAAGLP